MLWIIYCIAIAVITVKLFWHLYITDDYYKGNR